MALAAASAGGYIAGRMRSRFGDAVADEVEFRDGAHGLVVWAVATLGIGVVMAAVAAVPSMAANVSDVEPTANMLRWTANVSTIFAFASAAGAALSAAAAYMAVTVGGGHRRQRRVDPSGYAAYVPAQSLITYPFPFTTRNGKRARQS